MRGGIVCSERKRVGQSRNSRKDRASPVGSSLLVGKQERPEEVWEGRTLWVSDRLQPDVKRMSNLPNLKKSGEKARLVKWEKSSHTERRAAR